MSIPNVVVVGAGVSGLCAAIELESLGFAPTIVEAENQLGGRVKTVVVDGYPVDVGFQVLLTAYPAAQRYLDYEALELRPFKPGAVILGNGEYQRFGDFLRAPELFTHTLRSSVGSISDKWLTYTLSNRLKRKSIDSIFNESETDTMSYLRSFGFSDRIVQQFFVPFYGGIFLDPLLGTSSRMFEFTFKMFAEGQAAIPTNGMDAIPKQLAAKLKNTNLVLGQKVISYGNGVATLSDHSQLKCDHLIDSTGHLSRKSPAEWNGCATHYFYTRNNPINAPMIALSTGKNSPVNTFHFVSDLLGKHGDHHLLSVTCVGRNTSISHQEISNFLKEHAGINVVDHIHSDVIQKALPKLASVNYGNKLTQDPSVGIVACGDIMSNASLNGAMEAGRAAALTAAQYI